MHCRYTYMFIYKCVCKKIHTFHFKSESSAFKTKTLPNCSKIMYAYVCVWKKKRNEKKTMRRTLQRSHSQHSLACLQTHVFAILYYVNVASVHGRPCQWVVKVVYMPRHCRLKKRFRVQGSLQAACSVSTQRRQALISTKEPFMPMRLNVGNKLEKWNYKYAVVYM